MRMLGVWKTLVVVVVLFVVEVKSRKLAALVEEAPLVLTYHEGPLLCGRPVDVHVIWYGNFSAVQRSIVGDYVQSLGVGAKAEEPSVSTWWATTDKYGGKGKGAKSSASLGKQKMDEQCSRGKSLKRSDISALVEESAVAAEDGKGEAVYLVATAEDVAVEGFCMSSCGYHGSVSVSSKKMQVPYAWVGNSATQCPGQCAWPFHQPIYGPQTPPLLPPNADVGIDGMVINIATVLAGAVTNPFNTGYFQGDAAAPLEAVSACPGIYGKGAYPGFAGELLLDATSGASYNAHGLNGRRFLLPAMWDPATMSCKTLV